MPLAALRRRFAYHAWASAVLADAVTDAARHDAARRLLAHIVTADRVWLLRLLGEPLEATVLWPALDAAGLRALVRRAAEDYAGYLSGLTSADLGRVVGYRTTQGVPYETAVGDILEHVLLHGAYHRGQAATALRAAGDAPPWTDFIAWVRAGGN